MIISHKYRYLFVELPHTGTTAISKELRINYGGERVLFKHATYDEFLRQATPEEKAYFTFSNIRNPLDDAISCYFKYRNQVKGFIGFDVNSKPSLSNPRDLVRRVVYHYRYRRYRFIRDNSADFPTFFMKYYRLPYDNWSSLSHHKLDHIIRFESIQEDFSEVLRLLNIEQVRPLPAANQTSGRSRDFSSYYTPDTYARAAQVYGPYMKKWGYEFPPEWGELSYSWGDQATYEVVGFAKRLVWRYLRPAVYSLMVKKYAASSVTQEATNAPLTK